MDHMGWWCEAYTITGFRLFANDIKISSKLLVKSLQGQQLTRRESKLVSRLMYMLLSQLHNSFVKLLVMSSEWFHSHCLLLFLLWSFYYQFTCIFSLKCCHHIFGGHSIRWCCFICNYVSCQFQSQGARKKAELMVKRLNNAIVVWCMI